ncbi:MAG: hypothetical protein ABWX58_01875 [Psychrobacillus psychrotolerans]
MINNGEIEPRDIITHNVPLDKASEAYKMFHDFEDESIKFVLKP